MLESSLMYQAASASGGLSSRQVPALDGLRGIAVTLVFLSHLQAYIPGNYGPLLIVKAAFVPGWCGVDLFFVLSGFLITGILLDTKDANNYFSSFYVRRILRIFPLYYCVLTIILLVAHYRAGWLDSVLPLAHDRKFYFFYLNNWWPLLRDTWHGNIIGHFWSLAVEEQFYLLWPTCIWLLPRRRVLAACLGGFGIALALRVYLLAEFGPIRDVVENTFARMDSLLAGAACASLVRSPRLLKRITPHIGPMGLAAACILAFSLPGFWDPGLFMLSVGYSALAILFATIVLSAFLGRDETGSAGRTLQKPILTSLGKYSYGIYVYHVPLLMAGFAALEPTSHTQRSAWLSVAFASAAALTIYGIAKLSYEFFEKRFLRLKQRFKPVLPAERARLSTSAR